ncbi:serine/threonine-protein kinase ATM [Culicoides brevitarsis]|uniref:serine/threonine-protein kinase ATM n=1 Tax=Culicoides brevitarsis TaxID=469753 RepID=UPI00307B996F
MFAVIENAILAGKDNVAFKNIATMGKAAPEIDRNSLAMMNLEYAKLNWKHKNEALARQMFQELTKGHSCDVVTIEAHFLHGYHVKSSIDDPMKTFQEYFLKAHEMVLRYAQKWKKLEQMRKGHYDDDQVGRDLKKLSSIFEKIAKFFDKQYKHLSKYLVSTDYLKRKSVVERQEYSIEKLREKHRASQLEKDERSQLRVIEANFKLDKKNLEKYKTDRDTYLANALRYYGYACRYSTDESLHIFRIVSLFLSHKNVTAVREVIQGTMETKVPQEKEVLTGLFDSLPSFKFLDILPQLTAHLYNDEKPTYVDDEIYKLLRRCAIEHPHHTLNHIMSMKNSYADKSSQDRGQQTDSRVRGAEKLLHDIEGVNESLGTIISQLTSMTKALIRMANTKLRENAGDFQLTRNTDCGILSLKNLNAIHCPTFHLPVMKNGKYEGVIVSIVKWETKVGVLNGINAPKKFKCLCSDGVVRPQLLKGNDDLRQDAVMQQVFNIMNAMLAQNPKSAERRLQIRTYKVIPFSRRSGMLEWCSNTIPIGPILMDCHKRYRPHDKFSPNDARTRVQHSAPSDKLKIFNEIVKNLKPAFHNFFLEHFLTPGTLFERQYAYTNSVATNSIIGYILGIGDRHVQNILLDITSTEVIHIDFGIAFEQGKCLPTPETIPFRLTRDIIAGMGVTGIEGVFRKSAEITMQVLRDHQYTILAILQVLLYDPLYMWTLTPEKARRTQSLEWEPDVVTNTTAERALELCKDKLNGAENSSMGTMTIENQVDKLIREAISHENLCKLFHGWQAYL